MVEVCTLLLPETSPHEVPRWTFTGHSLRVKSGEGFHRALTWTGGQNDPLSVKLKTAGQQEFCVFHPWGTV